MSSDEMIQRYEELRNRFGNGLAMLDVELLELDKKLADD